LSRFIRTYHIRRTNRRIILWHTYTIFNITIHLGEFELFLFLFFPVVCDDFVVVFFSSIPSFACRDSKPRKSVCRRYRWVDDLKFRTTLIFSSLPYISVACLPVFCARQLSLVSRKRIYRNVIFLTLKTYLHAHGSPRPRTFVSLIMYVSTTILYHLFRCTK